MLRTIPPELVEGYRQRECKGIASFLEFMAELDEDESEAIFRLMFTRLLGMSESAVSDPIEFFSIMYKTQSRRSPFLDEGTKLIDTACSKMAAMWEQTAHGKVQ